MLLLLVGCTPSAYQALVEHQLSPDKPFCDAIEPIPPSRLNEVWKRFTDPLETGKTGIHLLEDGAGALTARAGSLITPPKVLISNTLYSPLIM